MNDLHQTVRDYLTLRRSLGFKLEREGRLLPDFVAFLDKSGSPVITVPLALAWAKQPATATAYWWAARLSMVRAFARYVRTIDARTEVPPDDALPRTRSRPQPYLYSDADVMGLMAVTRRIRDPFRAHTCRTLIGLLASTGMRVGEAINLDRTDLDRQEGVFTVRDAKFGKSREVPLHLRLASFYPKQVQRRDSANLALKRCDPQRLLQRRQCRFLGGDHLLKPKSGVVTTRHVENQFVAVQLRTRTGRLGPRFGQGNPVLDPAARVER